MSGKKGGTDASTMEYGRIPPQATDLEQAVLGALMLEKDAFVIVGDILKSESFYDPAHQKIFAAVQALFRNGAPVDQLTVGEELKKKGLLEDIGGPYYLSLLTSKVASAVHIEFHAKIIAQKYIQRKLIGVCTELQQMAYDESVDVSDLIDKSQKAVFELFDDDISNKTVEIRDIIEEAMRGIESASERTDGISGVPSGFTALDGMTHGWQPSDLVIIAARPSMGKTALVLNMARNMAIDYHVPVAFFSLEMSAVQLVNRFIASETELGAEKLKRGNLSQEDWRHLHSKIKVLEDAPIYIDDTPALSVMDLRRKCRRLKQKYDIRLIVIDYLQLMTAGMDLKNNRVQEVSIISRSLKVIAKELNIPVLALSQLNRGVELRTGDNKKPMLADLRESGSIEQDADIVLFIHRPDYYGVSEDEEGNDVRGITKIIIAKHRNGAVGEINLRFNSAIVRFENIGNNGFLPQTLTIQSSLNNEDTTFESKVALDTGFDRPPF